MSSPTTKERSRIRPVKSRHSAKLLLSGAITLEVVDELRQCLLNLIAAKKKLVIDVTDVSETDSSALQLLCAARRSANLKGIEFQMICNETGSFMNTAAAAGFHRAGGCSVSPLGVKLWDSESCSAGKDKP